VVVEAVERGRPAAPVRLEPLVDLAERTGVDSVQALLSIRSGDDHASFSEDPEVLGDAWLAEPQMGDELADGRLSVAKDAQDLAAMGLGEDGEGDWHAAT
jgi:hypothetical protein